MRTRWFTGGAVEQRWPPVRPSRDGLRHQVDPLAHVESLAHVGHPLPNDEHVIYRKLASGKANTLAAQFRVGESPLRAPMGV